MAAFDTILHTSGGNALELVKVTASANATYNFQPEHPIRAMSLQAIGGGGNNFGGGTVELKGSNDGVTFYSLPTSVTLSADGIKSVTIPNSGLLFYQIALTGSTSPTLSIWVNMAYNQGA